VLPKLEQFIQEKQYLTNVTAATTRWHGMSLRWLQSEEPTDDDIKSLVIVLRQRGRCATGVNTTLRAIRAYCRWAGLKTTVPRLKENQRVLPTYTTDNITQLIRWKPRTLAQHRLHTLCLTLLDTGARIAEALGLAWQDVDLDNLLVTLHGKGGRDRTVPVTVELRRRLVLWQKRQVNPSGLVLSTRDGRQLSHRNVLRDVTARCRRLGFNPPVRALHAMRHTFALTYVRNGGDAIPSPTATRPLDARYDASVRQSSDG